MERPISKKAKARPASVSEAIHRHDELAQTIQELKYDKMDVERRLVRMLMEEKRNDLFTVNWRRVRNAQRNGDFS